jgi:hypothetical protein
VFHLMWTWLTFLCTGKFNKICFHLSFIFLSIVIINRHLLLLFVYGTIYSTISSKCDVSKF